MRLIGDRDFEDCGSVPDHLFQPVLDRYLAATDKDYISGEYRSKRYAINNDIKSILFSFNSYGWRPKDSLEGKPVEIPDPASSEYTPEYEDWKPVISPLLDYIANKRYGKGVFNKCMIAVMKPGAVIPLHWDQDPTFTVTRRFHVPLVTDSNVIFDINHQQYNFETQRLIEINNLKIHGVRNNSNITRAHLIADYYHPDNVHNLLYGTDNKRPSADIKMRDYIPDVKITFNYPHKKD